MPLTVNQVNSGCWFTKFVKVIGAGITPWTHSIYGPKAYNAASQSLEQRLANLTDGQRQFILSQAQRALYLLNSKEDGDTWEGLIDHKFYKLFDMKTFLWLSKGKTVTKVSLISYCSTDTFNLMRL